MKKLLALSFAVVISFSVQAQNPFFDSLKGELTRAKTDSGRFYAAMAIESAYENTRQDSTMAYTQKALNIATRLNDAKMLGIVYQAIGFNERMLGNYPLALQMEFKSLQLFEGIHDSGNMAQGCNLLGNTYRDYGDYTKAIQYYNREKEIGLKSKAEVYVFSVNVNMSTIYTSLNKTDSALLFEQQAYEYAIRTHSTLTCEVLNGLANIQLKLNNRNLARDYYVAAIEGYKNVFGNSRLLSEGYLSFAGFYKKYNMADSAIYYARTAMNMAKGVPYLKGVSDAAAFLYASFDSLHQTDSALHYLKIFVATNDTLKNQTKAAEVEGQNFLEQVRQQEKEQEVLKQKEERNENMQYAAIALGILCFIVVFLMLSRRLITNPALITFFGVVALLMVFEFLNLFLHPFLEKVTHHKPVLMLVAMVCLAALLTPLHHWLEHFTTHRLVEKNKEARLAAAKKTIEKLEKKAE